MLKAIKIIAWTLLAVILIAVGLVSTTVRLLTSDRLTPLTEQIANSYLNADVSVSNVELQVRSSWPFIDLVIDDLAITSRDIKALPVATRDTLPTWADTLATVKHFRGGISLPQMMRGVIALSDLEIIKPRANVFILNEQINNFSIIKPTASTDTSSTSVPDIRIRSFKIKEEFNSDSVPSSACPLLRYYDAATGIDIAANLSNALIESEPRDGESLPHYLLDLRTNVESPLLDKIGLLNLPVGVDGTIFWQHDYPLQITLSDFTFALNKLIGNFNAGIDFSDQLSIQSFDLAIKPLSISDVLSAIPADTKAEYKIPSDIVTDATIAATVKLTHPYILGETALPHAVATVEIPECSLQWRKIDLRKFALDVEAVTHGSNLNAVTIDIRNLLAAGPATTLTVKGQISEILNDPLFHGTINGNVIIDRLPPIILNYINGSAKGTVKIDTEVEARPSMFSRNGFHRLKVAGTIDLAGFSYIAADTLKMAYANNAHLKFGTNEKKEMKSRDGQHTRIVDSLLTASVEVDSMQCLITDVRLKVKDFTLNVGALNNNRAADTSKIIPIGGKIHAGSFSVFTLTDTAGAMVRDLNGSVAMMRNRSNTHLPRFSLNCKIGKISAGNNYMRFMVNESNLRTSLSMLSEEQLPPHRREIKHLADSIRRTMPKMPIDSVYAYALEIKRRKSTGKKRVHAERTESDSEVIDWGTAKNFQRLLLYWDIKGSLTSSRAGLFTTSFPIRNRVKDLNIRFNNDSVIVTDLQYKVGHSDFLISGAVSNMKKAFTSSRKNQSIKAAFDILSDSIDINELAKAFFTGSANKGKKLDADLNDEEALMRELDKKANSKARGPLLVPVNIDAELRIRANNVTYSDMDLHDFEGSLLAYDGAVSLENLRAKSEVGNIDISALYAAAHPNDIRFGFGLNLDRFNISEFIDLVPAIDSIMPLMRDISGIINAKVAATVRVDSTMNLNLPTLNAVVNLSGDSLVVIDRKTFNKIAKWLLFKDKQNDTIKHMAVELSVQDNVMQIYPFVFDFDRYRLGVQGSNNMNLDMDYHVSVLKSPLPFKFGVNIKGTPENLKIRLGRARFNEKESAKKEAIADTTRVNLIEQFQNIFKRGVRNSEFAKVQISKRPTAQEIDLNADTISAADSTYFINAGLIPYRPKPTPPTNKNAKRK